MYFKNQNKINMYEDFFKIMEHPIFSVVSKEEQEIAKKVMQRMFDTDEQLNLTNDENIAFGKVMSLMEMLNKSKGHDPNQVLDDESTDKLYEDLMCGNLDHNKSLYQFSKDKAIENLLVREEYEKIDALVKR